MPMNIDGNFVTQFGERLPVPYMEQINIRDTSIEIQMAMYLKPPDDTDVAYEYYQDYLDELENLTVSIVGVADSVKTVGTDTFSSADSVSSPDLFYSKYGPIEISEYGTQLFDKLKSNDINILQIAEPTNRTYNTTSTSATDSIYATYLEENVKNFEYGGEDDSYFAFPNASSTLYAEKINFSDYSKDDLYTSDGELVNKYTWTITIQHDASRIILGGVDTVAGFISSAVRGHINVNFVAFTTSLAEYPNGFSESQKFDILRRKAKANILFEQVSDLSYERIFSDGAVKSTETTIFKTMNDVVFNGNILQSIDSTYYGNSQLTNESIIQTFSDLIGTTSDEELQSKFDNLAYTLQVHGKNDDILVKINDFRKTFVETSTATPVGRFHETLEIRLFNANNAVKRGIRLQKLLNVSPAVIDSLTVYFVNYEFPTWEEDESFQISKATNYIYTNPRHSLIGAYAMPSGYQFSTQEAQAVFDALDADISTFEETVEQFEDKLYDLYSQIHSAIFNAFRDMWQRANNVNEGIPEDYPTKTRMNAGTYESVRLRTITSTAPIDDYGGISLGRGYAGRTYSTGDETVHFEIYAPRIEDAGDLNQDGEVTSKPVYLKIAPKIWPLDLSFYMDVFNDFNIVQLDVYNFRDDGVLGNAVKEVSEIDLANYLRLSTGYGSIEFAKYFGHDNNAGGRLDKADEFAKRDPDFYFSRRPNGAYDPNCFYEMTRAVERAYMQSGRITTISIDVTVEGGFSLFSWLIAEPNESMYAGYTFDSGTSIRNAVNAYKESYRGYIEALVDLAQIQEKKEMYAELVALGGVAEVDLIYTDYNLYTTGFTFFDYEKALKRASNISRILNVSKIESLFGRELSHTYFKLTDGTLTKIFDNRYERPDTDEGVDYVQDYSGMNPAFEDITVSALIDRYSTSPVPARAISNLPSDYENKGKITSYPQANYTFNSIVEVTEVSGPPSPYTYNYQQMAIALPNVQYTKYVSGPGSADDDDLEGSRIGRSVEQPSFGSSTGPGVGGNNKYTFFIPRSWEMMYDENKDYRLICYEMQDVAGSFKVGDAGDGYGQNTADGFENQGGDFGSDYLFTQNPLGSSYVITFGVEDATKDMYVAIARTLHKAIGEYQIYYDAINEECSFNDSDQRMNKFFIDAVLNNYSSQPHLAPWYRVPLIYNTHLDLIYNKFGGNKDNIIKASIDMSQKLHPDNITLGEADSFLRKLLYLDEQTYKSATWQAKFTERDYVDRKIFGGFNCDDGYYAMLGDLPQPVNLDYLGWSFKSGDVVGVDVDDLP